MVALRGVRFDYMLQRTAGLLLSRELPGGREGTFSVAMVPANVADSIIFNLRFFACLNLIRMGAAFLEHFEPRLARIVQSERTRAKSRTRVLSVQRPGAEQRSIRTSFSPSLTRADRTNLALLLAELAAHATVLKRAYTLSELGLPDFVQSQLVPAIGKLAADLDQLLIRLGGAGFPIDEARTKGLLFESGFAELAASTTDEGTLAQRAQRYRGATGSLFDWSLEPSTLAADAFTWRNAYLSMSTGLGAGAHFSHGYSLDTETLYGLWCFMEISGTLVRRGSWDLLGRLKCIQSNNDRPNDYYGLHALSNRPAPASLSKLPARIVLLGASPNAPPVIMSTSYAGWSKHAYLLALAMAVESGGRRGILLVSDEHNDAQDCQFASQSRVMQEPNAPKSYDIRVASLCPDERRESDNQIVIEGIINDIFE